jgi:hypothetical protein
VEQFYDLLLAKEEIPGQMEYLSRVRDKVFKLLEKGTFLVSTYVDEQVCDNPKSLQGLCLSLTWLYRAGQLI